MKASFIITALRKRHPENAWAFAIEVPTTTGHGRRLDHKNGPGGTRRIDAFSMALWPSKGYTRVAYEIKVARADWLGELHKPEKRAQAYYLSNEFYFVLAEGIFKKTDIAPKSGKRVVDEDLTTNCGIMEVKGDGSIKIIYPAKRRTAWPMPESFVASFLRRVRDLEWKKDIRNWL